MFPLFIDLQENVMSIAESDWKKFKELRKIALDRCCQVFSPMPRQSLNTGHFQPMLGMECSMV
jgi:hypothetical protein